MTGLCEGGNEPPGFLKAICIDFIHVVTVVSQRFEASFSFMSVPINQGVQSELENVYGITSNVVATDGFKVKLDVGPFSDRSHLPLSRPSVLPSPTFALNSPVVSFRLSLLYLPFLSRRLVPGGSRVTVAAQGCPRLIKLQMPQEMIPDYTSCFFPTRQGLLKSKAENSNRTGSPKMLRALTASGEIAADLAREVIRALPLCE
ncbi:hypothetical protein ANN_01392 [Periplaneta americana]|uniref:Uncharacterized protein n=1 Tax=Periplaneta americana TaxID=6978 RepID=A0ABQ8TXI0_PERAM|nr:hypothetical protein ANN_01392 [Periplaneta americana]